MLLSEVDVDWVDGNTMPQLMTHGAGDICLSHIVYVLFFRTLGPFQSDLFVKDVHQ